MTATAIRVSPSPPPGEQRSRPPRRLVAVSVLVMAPLVFPVLYLLWQAGIGGPIAGSLPAGRLLQLAFNTMAITVAVMAAATLIGVTTAWLTTRTSLPAARTWSTLVALPLVIPSYVGALILLSATGRQGYLSILLEPLGWGPVPIPRGFFGAWLALTLFTYPYVHLMLVPALRRLDASQEEAARGLGASPGRVLRTVVLPQIAPSLRSASLLVGLYTLADFGAVSLLRYDTFTRAIYLQYAGRLDRRPATVLAALLVVIALVIVGWERHRRGPMTVLGGRSMRPPPLVRLRRGQTAGAVAYLSGLVLVALVIPLWVLVAWLQRGMAAGQIPAGVTAETVRSLLVAAGAAILAVTVALPLAVLLVRYQSRWGAAVEATTWSLYALPHLTVGLAVLLVGVSLATPLYQSLPLLLFAYLMMFLAQALGPAQAALRQVSPRLEEVSRSLGRSAISTLRRVTTPLMARGVLAGAGLVFLTTMKELPATLVLRPTGFETLAVRIWSATSEGFYTRASLAALVLLAASAIPFHLLVTRDLHG